MNKGIFIKGLACLLLSSRVFASGIIDNFYGEINLGANFVRIARTLTYPVGTSNPTQAELASSYNNFHGQLALGYDFPLINRWNLALEGDVDLFAGKASTSALNWFASTPAYASERFSYGWEIFALPEYTLNPMVRLFAGPGVAWGQFQVNSNNAITAGNLGYTGSKSFWLDGWGLKAGTAIHLSPSFDLLLTYQLMDYQTTTVIGVEPLTATTVQTQYHPFINCVMVGLKYQFGADSIRLNKPMKE